MGADDEAGLSTKLPLDDAPETRPAPWLLNLIDVNTMNFCAFASCATLSDSSSDTPALLIAVPNTLESEAVSLA